MDFSYFSVTDSTKSLSFGPGLLKGIAAGFPTSFVIQAKDKTGADRICGMDEFCVSITELDVVKSAEEIADEGDGAEEPEEHIDAFIIDHNDGTYTVEYTPPKAGRYRIDVEFEGTFKGAAGAIRGSPFFPEAAEDVDESMNSLQGPLLMNAIRVATKGLKDFSDKSIKGMNKKANKEDVKTLIAVKEHLRNVAERADELNTQIDINMASLLYMKRNGAEKVDSMISALESATDLWRDASAQAPITANAIVPLNRVWVEKTEKKMEAYLKSLARGTKSKKADFLSRPFWAYINPETEKVRDGSLTLNEKGRLLTSTTHSLRFITEYRPRRREQLYEGRCQVPQVGDPRP